MARCVSALPCTLIEQLRTTTTGIISPHGQPSTRQPSPPPASKTGERDLDAIAAAKQAAVRATLYGRFLRGPVLAPESEPPAPEPVAAVAPIAASSPIADPSPIESKAERKERRRLKREAKLAAASVVDVASPSEPALPAALDEDAARRERKQQRRAEKAARAAATALTRSGDNDVPPSKRKKRKHQPE